MRPTREMRPRPILSSGLGGAIEGAGGDVTITDTGNYYTSTTLVDILQEIGAKLLGYQSHGNLGATETFDASVAGWHSGTVDADLTVTLTGATTGIATSMILELTQDGTGGWTLTLPASVLNAAALEAAFDDTAGNTSLLLLMSRDGGTNWFGFWAGSSSGSALTIEDEGTPLATDATTLDFVGSPVTATGAGAEKTITVQSNEPVTYNPGAGPDLVFDGDDLVMEWVA